jgi:PBP1b-binding outer membrane lipoprotein LpoB
MSKCSWVSLSAAIAVCIAGCGAPPAKPKTAAAASVPVTPVVATAPTKPEDVRTVVMDIKGMS